MRRDVVVKDRTGRQRLDPSDPNGNVLSVENVSCEVGGRDHVGRPVKDVSFQVRAGKALAIVGESGSGKSLTCLTMLGLLPPSVRMVSGEIWFGDTNLANKDSAEWRKIRGNDIAYVPQDSLGSLNALATVERHIAAPLRAHGYERGAVRERVIELLSMVRLSSPEKLLKVYPHQLSGGMRQRVVIAAALAMRPKILIADEPTTALDPTIQLEVLRLLKDLQNDLGMSLVLVTHNFGVVRAICDDVVVLYAGRVVEQGTVEQVVESPVHPYTQGLLRSVPDAEHPRGEPLYSIPGQPATPFEMEVGCAFAPRCSKVHDRCLQADPPLFSLADDRFSRCWLSETKDE
jgi:oligopeptide/dipeptide ABC transporter ATP-binding protein